MLAAESTPQKARFLRLLLYRDRRRMSFSRDDVASTLFARASDAK